MKQKIALVSLIFVICVLYGGAFAFYGRTLAPLATVVIVAAAVSAVLWLPMAGLWQRAVTGMNNVICFLMHLVSVTSVTLFAILALNYFGADTGSTAEHKAVISKKYFEERETSRGRRHHSFSGRRYKVWYMTLCLDDGRTKNVQITLEKYNRIRVGDTCSVPVSEGLFGMPVVRAFP